MCRIACFCCVLCSLLLTLFASIDATAQQRAHSARAFVQSPHVLAMGNAAAAFPSAQSVLFYNPAHLLHLPAGRAPIVMVGFNGSLSPNFPGQWDFYRERLQPALNDGLDALGEAQRQALYGETLRLGRHRIFAGGDVLLPSFLLNRGRYGFGGGLFAASELRYLAEASGAGAPAVDFVSQADFMAVAAGALDLSEQILPGLTAGLAVKYTQRYVILKNKRLDQLDDSENYYVLGGGALGADLGLHYVVRAAPLPGAFHVGAVLYDALGGHAGYSFKGYYTRNAPDDPATLAAETALARERLRRRPSYRVGVAYTTPPDGPLARTGVALDYLHDPGLAPGNAAADHLRLGVQLGLSRDLALRAGLNRSRPSVGAGLRLPFATFDYAYHHVRERGLPHGWNHTLQVTLGSF